MSKTSETPQSNPLRDGLATRAVPQACTVVFFGVPGELVAILVPNKRLAHRFTAW